MTTLAIRASCAACVFLPAVLAQQTFVVDQNGGGQFTDIPPAIAAASPGDTILVRPGTYSIFALDKGCRVLGDPGAALTGSRGGAFEVSNLPLGQSAVVRGFTGSFGVLTMSILDSAGHVHVESIVTGGPLASALMRRAQNVTLVGITCLAPGVVVEQSTVAMTSCWLEGEQTGAALTARGSRVWFSEGTCRGAAALPPFFPSSSSATCSWPATRRR
jgi:hypothetical protein